MHRIYENIKRMVSVLKDLGVVRSVDNLGRLVIPIEVRRQIGLAVGEPVHMYVENGKVIVEKHKDSCMLCGSRQDVTPFKDKRICANCLMEIRDMGKEGEA